MKVSIRNAEKNDIEEIMLIEHESFSENIAESRDLFFDRIELFADGFLVMITEGEIAGYVSSELWEYLENIDTDKFHLNHPIIKVHKNNGLELYISSIGVLKKHRGKGYGNMLFSELTTRISRKYKITSIILIVSVKWDVARKIYENNGFVEVQRLKRFFDDDDNSDAIVMRKHL